MDSHSQSTTKWQVLQVSSLHQWVCACLCPKRATSNPWSMDNLNEIILGKMLVNLMTFLGTVPQTQTPQHDSTISIGHGSARHHHPHLTARVFKRLAIAVVPGESGTKLPDMALLRESKDGRSWPNLRGTGVTGWVYLEKRKTSSGDLQHDPVAREAFRHIPSRVYIIHEFVMLSLRILCINQIYLYMYIYIYIYAPHSVPFFGNVGMFWTCFHKTNDMFRPAQATTLWHPLGLGQDTAQLQVALILTNHWQILSPPDKVPGRC